MTTRTISELVQGVLEDMGLINVDHGETPSPGDAAMIERRYRNMLAEMQDENIVYWDADAIPLEAFEAVVGIMTLVVGPAFGMPKVAEGEEFNNALEGAKRRLRRRVVKPASNETVARDDSYF